MVIDPDPYINREHMQVKHELLSNYLGRVATIVGVGGQIQEFVYVDAFAGPWEASTSDYSDTSFGRALKILEGAFEAINKQRACRIRAIFIEKADHAFEHLSAFTLAYRGNVSAECWHGDFQTFVPKLAKLEEFAFYLIDPKGWKDVITPSVLQPLLQKRNAELLITFMWRFLKLAVGHYEKVASQRQNVENVFGPIGELLKDQNREHVLVQRYRHRISDTTETGKRARIRTFSFGVNDAGLNSIKYYLIFACHHPRGLIEFATNASGSTGTQLRQNNNLKLGRRDERMGMNGDLFGATEQRESNTQNTLMNAWLSLIPNVGDSKCVDTAQFADLLETYNCFPDNLQSALRLLIENRRVAIDGVARLRPKHVIHFQKGEVLRRMQ